MKWFRRLSRIIRWAFALYSLLQVFRQRRWLGVGWLLWDLLSRRRVRDLQPAATWIFVNGGEPAIYRRRAWRKIPADSGHKGRE